MTKVFTKPRTFYDTFERKGGADPQSTHYCPGCGHGTVHKLIAEAIDDLEIGERTILVSPVGCAVFAYYYLDVGNVQAAHGRAPAVATGIKRARPHSIVITYQGDGDLAAIGLNNIMQAANRGEQITVFFINNALYGMTGGQMAPTTLIGQKTTTTPSGRNPENEGYPLAMCEILTRLPAPVYIERVAVGSPKQVMRARKAVRKALTCQIEGKGFAFVEILSQCPTGWQMTPEESIHWLEQELMPVFPLGVFRDEIATRPARSPSAFWPSAAEIQAVALAAGKSKAPGSEAVAAGEPAATRPRPERGFEARIKVAGFGGQGVLYLGEVLAEAGMRSGLDVSWLPSYGPEMRGGTAHCHVMLSAGRIGSPLVERATHLIAMNRPSLERFGPEVVPGGAILYDSSLIESPPELAGRVAIPIPATATADRLGTTRVANTVLLGALVAHLGQPDPESVLRTLAKAGGKAELSALNRQAFAAGFELGSAAATSATPATSAATAAAGA
jgi:2-oxoisovalerate ferredoxin oxidoreductase beta subunit